jgi:hypothetical protein
MASSALDADIAVRMNWQIVGNNAPAAVTKSHLPPERFFTGPRFS